MSKHDYSYDELDHVEEEALVSASLPLGAWGSDNARDRYNTYRRKGYAPADALRYTIAWCRNMADQRANRLGHGTGAINWV